MAITDDTFKELMKRFASGVTLITFENEGVLSGLTVSSFCSLSMNPPLILICIDKKIPSHDSLKNGASFGVNICTSEQGKLAWDFANSNVDNNFIEGNIITKNSKNCYLRSEKRLIAAIGIQNLIVVETSDAILISDKSQSQEVKNIVNILKKKGIPEGQEHKKMYRPWGSYTSIETGDNWQLKTI